MFLTCVILNMENPIIMYFVNALVTMLKHLSSNVADVITCVMYFVWLKEGATVLYKPLCVKVVIYLYNWCVIIEW